MTTSARGGLLGLALILLVAVAFAAGMRWSEHVATGKSVSSCDPTAGEAGSMAGCPMMGMERGAKTAAAKDGPAPASTGKCPMAQMGSGSVESQGAKPAEAPAGCCAVTGEKPAAPADPAVEKP